MCKYALINKYKIYLKVITVRCLTKTREWLAISKISDIEKN